MNKTVHEKNVIWLGKRINKLEAKIKRQADKIEELGTNLLMRKIYCIEFSRWWYNQRGTDIDRGYDNWSSLGYPKGAKDIPRRPKADHRMATHLKWLSNLEGGK